MHFDKELRVQNSLHALNIFVHLFDNVLFCNIEGPMILEIRILLVALSFILFCYWHAVQDTEKLYFIWSAMDCFLRASSRHLLKAMAREH